MCMWKYKFITESNKGKKKKKEKKKRKREEKNKNSATKSLTKSTEKTDYHFRKEHINILKLEENEMSERTRWFGSNQGNLVLN